MSDMAALSNTRGQKPRASVSSRLRRVGSRTLLLVIIGVFCVSCTGHESASVGTADTAQSTGSGDIAQDETNAGEGIAKAADNSDEPVKKDLPPLNIEIPKPGKIGDPKEATQKVTTVVETLVAVKDQVTTRADGQIVGIENIADGFVKGEIEALAAERSQMGVHQVGTAKIVSVEAGTINSKAKHPTLEIKVCIDLSGIDVIDEQGNSLGGLLYRPKEPVLNIYGAVFRDDQWKISTHTIPEDSSCKSDTHRGN